MGKNQFDISFGAKGGNRQAYRAQISGLHVKLAGRAAVYSAKDLSPTGAGLAGSTGLRQGEMVEIGLYYKGKLIAAEITAKVVRATADFTGLLFINPNRRQADAIHALVLKEQKAQAEKRRQHKMKKG